MYKLILQLFKRYAAILLILNTAGANAALVNVDITGTVLSGDELGANAFGLTAGDMITATAVFDDSLLGAGTVSFGTGYTLSIDVNGTIFTHADDTGASLTFAGGLLTDFDFFTSSPESFNSLGMYFDDFGGAYGDLFGEWNSVVSVSPVPVPAAVWLFGSGLLGLVGVARRKAA